MLNIGIYFETSAKLGGSHQQNLKLIDIFDKYSSKEFNFIYIFTDNNSKTFFKNRNINSIFFKKNFIHKLELFFFRLIKN